MRYGAVSYLNARPLTEGLEPLVLDTPARLVERYRKGELDVALLPVAAAESAGLSRAGNLGIAADGAVESVRLFLRKPLGVIRTLQPDPASRTSNVLARLLLQEAFDVTPALVDRDGDCEVVIGDAALVRASDAGESLDLGETWKWYAGLPFVFAAWYGDERAQAELEVAYERGRARIPFYAAQAALGLDPASLETYLRERIRYRLGGRELGGLRRFLETARALALL